MGKESNQLERGWPEAAIEAPPMSLSQSYTLEEQLREDLFPINHQDGLTACNLPETTPVRQQASTSVQSLDRDVYLPGRISLAHGDGVSLDLSSEKTVLYLAYGSNLASETFLGMRGIKPLSQLNVVVPDLRLTFDLPGVPYLEPCFAGTHFRNTSANNVQTTYSSIFSEKHSLLQSHDRDQDRYKGPLIGVVYEVTLPDYAKIIATEGGGRGYKDIVVTCYPFPPTYCPTDPIPEYPDTQPMKAHTLLSPAGLKELLQLQLQPPSYPDTSLTPRYAQPSARYLNLITTGAAEHNLPLTYREYLAQIQPYRITSVRQQIGKVIFLAMWGPSLLMMLALARIFARPDGRSPRWVARLTDLVFAGMWSSYDHVFMHIFGDGERTVER
ncbi:hypothetical protein BJX61DRAFT_537621 [Aspergillus egyptiacus]|nr:hypothetical protein BJX61DRAFT_537621 [Aspergillus egyptiacus]